MRHRVVHLINPKNLSLTTRPMWFGRALYSPLAGLLQVASAIPRDRYEVVLTDENVEPIDDDIDVDLVGISAMTSYVQRGYEIADHFRAKGVPVVMGGVHPSFMPQEALLHCDAVVIGEAELIMEKVLDDLERGEMRGIYKSRQLHPMVGLPPPRYDLLKKNRYVNRTFVQTSRGCFQGCTFCAEPLMNGLRFRYRPVEEIVREIEASGQRYISINDADFFGTKKRPMEVMQALKKTGVRWQAGVTSKLAQDDELLEMAADSGCYLLSVGFESISRSTLTSVHKYVNKPETYAGLVDKVHSYGINMFGLFIFGFDGDDPSVFDETVKFNIAANFDACAYSVLTPYPGTLTWFEMKKQNRIVSYDWKNYDQGTIVYRPAGMTAEELRDGHIRANRRFYSLSSMARRFPWGGGRNRSRWAVYNAFMRRGTRGDPDKPIPAPTAEPSTVPTPPIMPKKKEWLEAVIDGGAMTMDDEVSNTVQGSRPA